MAIKLYFLFFFLFTELNLSPILKPETSGVFIPRTILHIAFATRWKTLHTRYALKSLRKVEFHTTGFVTHWTYVSFF